MASDYKELRVWNEAMSLVTQIYQIVANLPKSETYGLADQIKRSAVSIPSNIAEGHARDSQKEFSRFLGFAIGSAAELETQILLCRNIGFLTDHTNLLLSKLTDIRKMLVRLKIAIDQSQPRQKS